MKAFRRTLSALLSVCMVVTMMAPAFALQSEGQTQESVATTSVSAVEGYEYSIVMVDCGRKYYSVDSLKSIIDSASSAGMHYVMLGVGNDGLRLLLDDMSLTVGDVSYDSQTVKDAVHAGNEAYYNFDVDELTQTEMDTIISYAGTKGVEIIPLINTPGHMDAILDAAEAVTGTTCSYSNSGRTIDVTNSTATAFTQALLKKYISYFAGKGCTLFNMGCDEYANDVYNTGGMGFANLVNTGKYSYFVTYVNEIAALVKQAGMTPMAFNDGIYYNQNTSSGTFDQDIMICYWSSGWSGYNVASASYLAGKGHKMVNTNGDYYWIVGGTQCSAAKAGEFSITTFMGSTVEAPVGAMFCIWSDYPGALSDSDVASSVASVISAFGAVLPETPERTSHSGQDNVTVTDSDIGISVTAPGITSVTASEVENSTVAPGYRVAAAYDITVDGGAYTGSATIRIPYSDVFAGCTQFIGYADTDPFAVTLEDGYFVGTVPHFSTVTISGTYAAVEGDTLIIEYWITNQKVKDELGLTTYTISSDQGDVGTETGVEISTLIAVEGTNENGNLCTYWKTTLLDSDHWQTNAGGDDETQSGTDFKYIRYYENSWQYSVDGADWVAVQGTDQIVAYYLQVSTVTKEVTTQVADWGTTKSHWSELNYLNDQYVLMGYTVKYEDGTEVPDSYPSEFSLGYHCLTTDPTVSKDSDGYYYRRIGAIRAVETDDYEVYMITLTPTTDAQAGDLSWYNASYNTSYTYKGTEKVVWAESQEVLDNSELGTYTSISGKYTYRIGGDPVVNGLEIYKQHGMKVTYYVRAKPTEDSLTVRYVETSSNQEFYNYLINVSSGIIFDEEIGLNTTNWKGDLVNATVTNVVGENQTVSADLSTMPAISVAYRYSEYTCTKVERSDDGRTVTLYYTFSNSHGFVMDFGLPLNITREDLGITGDWTKATISDGVYGTATAVVGEGVTYTPNRVIEDYGRFTLTLYPETGEPFTHFIYLVPATLVFYEANDTFCDFTAGWTVKDSGEKFQDVYKYDETVSERGHNYGYDPVYNSAGSYDVATASEAAATVSFGFTGDGVDIYADTVTGGAYVMVWVKDASGATEKILTIDTAVKDGTTAVTEYGGAYKSAPIASIEGLTHGKHTVDIRIIKAGTFNFTGFRVHNTLLDNPAATPLYEYAKEDNPNYIELRNGVLSAITPSPTDTPEQVYDGSEPGTVLAVGAYGNEVDLTDLLNNGPKNELFVNKNYSVTFTLNTANTAQIGLHSADGNPVTYKITAGDGTSVEKTLTSTVDMFYDLQAAGGTVGQTYTITVTNDGVLSITDIKVTGASSTAAALAPITQEAVAQAMFCMGYEPEPVLADATLTVQVEDLLGHVLGETTLSYTGEEGESHTFTKSEIQAAVEAYAQEKGYVVSSLNQYQDVTVVCGEAQQVTYYATDVESVVEKVTSIWNKVISIWKGLWP